MIYSVYADATKKTFLGIVNEPDDTTAHTMALLQWQWTRHPITGRPVRRTVYVEPGGTQK